MSGLAALFHRDGRPVDRTSVWQMLQAVPYRGPDGMTATVIDNQVALGHARMDVTPEDALNQQPVISPRTGCAIIADVRIDNRTELLNTLVLPAAIPISDAELILRGYEAWGVSVLDRMLGDFALVIWDAQHRRIIAARDTSGQRGLFYRVNGQTFAAASEIHQLLQDPLVPVLPNEDRIRDFLVPQQMFSNEKDNAATFYKSLFSIPAGHVLTVTSDSVTVRKYWELAPPAELRYRHDADYAEHFRELFSQVVKTRLRVSGRVGALLSGGLDSSSVACTALEQFRIEGRPAADFSGFSMVFDGLECDERDLIQEMVAKYRFDAQFIPLGQVGGRLQLAPKCFMESPNMGISDARDAIFSAVQASSVRVLLTGDVADSCVGGTRYVFDSLIRQARIHEFIDHVRAYRRVSTDSYKRILGRYTLLPLLPRGVQKQVNLAIMRREFSQIQHQMLPPWMPQSLREDLSSRHGRLLFAEEHHRRFSNDSREAEYRMLYPPEVGRHPVPWPIEIWRPFTDRRLHEFLFAIPPEQKFKPHPETDEFYAGSKRVVRQAMHGIVPEPIRTRIHKTMFGEVAQSELECNWPLYEVAFGPSATPAIAEHGYVDQAKFWSRLQTLRSKRDTPDAIYVMQMISLETWLRSFLLPRDQLVKVSGGRSANSHSRLESLSETHPAGTL
ncbi:MAG: asparagine synthase-related protein [Chloroflexota bacterium]